MQASSEMTMIAQYPEDDDRARFPPETTLMHARPVCFLMLSVVFLANAPSWGAETIFRCGNELIIKFPRLDQWRQAHEHLNALVRLTGVRGEKVLPVNLSERLTPEALVIDLTEFGACSAVSVDVQSASGKAVHSERVSPLPTVKIADLLPQTNRLAAIELGSKHDPAAMPRIPLPDLSQLRVQKLVPATRAIMTDSITYPVVTSADLPGISSNNAVIVSRQSFAPRDSNEVSLYFSYRKAIYDTATSKLKEYRKMLIEVPLDRAWINRPGDAPILLPLKGFAIHTTEERELANPRWNDPRGYNMLGGSSSGLYQGGQSAEVDDEGRIYISNVADGAGIIRFNPHTAKFEQPPVNLVAELRKFIPSNGNIKLNWDLELAQLLCRDGRLFVVFDRHYRNTTPNGTFETCSGVVSLPLDHWDDAAEFGRDLRLHAACWPTASFPLYSDEISVGSYRRIGAPPQATQHGLVFGEYRLDLDEHGNTQRLSRIKSIKDTVDQAGQTLTPTEFRTIKGLSRQRYINVGGAGRQFVRQAYGEFTISRASLALTMPDVPQELLADQTGRYRTTFPGAPTGEVTVRFDITGKIKSDPQKFATLADAMVGTSQGPNYAVIDVPGEADQAIGVCEYSYFYSKLDFSRRANERRVYKSYLPTVSNGQVTGQPATVGVGPYNSAWVEHDNALWLYIPGYTGIARLKYAVDGKPLAGFNVESIHTQLLPQSIDGHSRDGVKDFLYVLPTTDNRLINIGRGRFGRGGGARSAGLELFDPRTLGKSESAVNMNRCYGLFTPVSRLILSASGSPARQEIYVASGNIRPEYVEDLANPGESPQNQDPKIFAYDCASGTGLRDLYGFSLPLNASGDNSSNLAFSRCRQFLVVMQGNGTLLTYSVAQRRFVDGVQLCNTGGEPIHLLGYSKPSAWIWTAPNGQIFFHAALDRESKSVNFYNVEIANTGRITVVPQLSVTSDKVGAGKDFDGIVRCFLPDLKNCDGSYDLVLGGDSENGGQPTVRVVDDFVTADW